MNFWEELRSLDEPTKTKILVVATVLIMVVVVYFLAGVFQRPDRGEPSRRECGGSRDRGARAAVSAYHSYYLCAPRHCCGAADIQCSGILAKRCKRGLHFSMRNL